MSTLKAVIDQTIGRVRAYRDRRIRLTVSDTIRVLNLPVMSFTEWKCRVTGWTAIGIYKWALLRDGRLFEALRDETK